MNWFRLSNIIYSVDKTEFDVTVEEQRRYLHSLGDARNDIDRSFKQYKCQAFFMPLWKILSQNVVALLLFFPFMLWLLAKRIAVHFEYEIPAIGEFLNLEEVLPKIITDTYAINNQVWSYKQSLSISDAWFLLTLFFGYIYHPYFSLKCMLKMAMYSTMIKNYRPKYIFVHNEYSFTSSILTLYCRKKGIRHIDVMHGEKYFFIRDAYFHYDECYVWDQYYIDLFMSLKAEGNQFVIAVPPSLKIDTDKYQNIDCYADYKYYLDLYTEEELKKVINSLTFIKKEGKSIKFRPHPRYSDIHILRKYINESEIENPREINILESVSNMNTAIGSCTTVLLQAFFSGKGVILDDVAFEKQYEQLKELGYFLSNRNLPKLSSYQEKYKL